MKASTSIAVNAVNVKASVRSGTQEVIKVAAEDDQEKQRLSSPGQK